MAKNPKQQNSDFPKMDYADKFPGSVARKHNLHSLLSQKYTNKCQYKIKVEKLNLKPIGFGGKIAYVLHNVFSKEECEAMIRETEELGYSQALIHSGDRAILAKGYRDSQRVMVDDELFTQILFKRIGHLLPQKFQLQTHSNIYKLKEINERLRFLRYDPGDQFKHHCDGAYERPDGSARTWITLQMYLNEGMVGGETTFLKFGNGESLTKPQNRIPVVPKTGSILVFQHNILHEGSLVKEGKKYTIRTDVLYEYDPEANVEEDTQEEDEEKRNNCTIA